MREIRTDRFDNSGHRTGYTVSTSHEVSPVIGYIIILLGLLAVAGAPLLLPIIALPYAIGTFLAEKKVHVLFIALSCIASAGLVIAGWYLLFRVLPHRACKFLGLALYSVPVYVVAASYTSGARISAVSRISFEQVFRFHDPVWSTFFAVIAGLFGWWLFGYLSSSAKLSAASEIERGGEAPEHITAH